MHLTPAAAAVVKQPKEPAFMQVACVVVGMLEVNCYLVWQEDSREALVIDPGDDVERIAASIAEHELCPRAILLTHAHVDHIRAVPGIAKLFGIPVWCHARERELYASPANALLPWLPAAEGLPEPSHALPSVSGLEYTVLETAGHTPGGVCYYFPAAGMLFSGDTLFQDSIGRADLPGGNADVLLRSIRERLLCLPPETKVYPGHGAATTIGAEARLNPYLAPIETQSAGYAP